MGFPLKLGSMYLTVRPIHRNMRQSPNPTCQLDSATIGSQMIAPTSTNSPTETKIGLAYEGFYTVGQCSVAVEWLLMTCTLIFKQTVFILIIHGVLLACQAKGIRQGTEMGWTIIVNFQT